MRRPDGKEISVESRVSAACMPELPRMACSGLLTQAGAATSMAQTSGHMTRLMSVCDSGMLIWAWVCDKAWKCARSHLSAVGWDSPQQELVWRGDV